MAELPSLAHCKVDPEERRRALGRVYALLLQLAAEKGDVDHDEAETHVLLPDDTSSGPSTEGV